MISPPFPSKVLNLDSVMDAIVEAGEKIREIYDTDFEVNKKDDNSPITKADLESNKILRFALEKTGIPILSEEDVDDKSRLDSEKVWIIDPLDGTQDFVNRTGEFTILVGLVENHIPVMWLVYLPTKRILYFAEKGMGAFCYDLNEWRKISVRRVEEISSCLALVSRHHLSVNEKKVDVNSLVRDALSHKSMEDDSNSTKNVLSYPLKEAREKFEKDYLTSQLKKNKGNISKTAEFVGMERSALHRKLKTLGIKGVN